jgi:hypothetical protein
MLSDEMADKVSNNVKVNGVAASRLCSRSYRLSDSDSLWCEDSGLFMYEYAYCVYLMLEGSEDNGESTSVGVNAPAFAEIRCQVSARRRVR